MRIPPGTRLGIYEVAGLISAGGMGEVYRARDTRLGRDVALKVQLGAKAADPDYVRRFEQEASSASVLNHPNIVTIYGAGDDGDIVYLAMELVDGSTLRDLLRTRSFSVAETVAIATQLADALATAHDAGIVHRDLKPDNVMLTPRGLVKVLDFGLAKRAAPLDAVTQAVTLDGLIVGTPGYMSPEQAAGRPVGPASDQFAFGLILYELLSHQRAFQGDSVVEILSATIRDTPAPLRTLNAAVPLALEQLVQRCLAKSPADRFAGAGELRAALSGGQALIGDPAAGGRTQIGDRARITRRRMLLAGAATGAVAAAAAAATLVPWRWPLTPAGARTLAVMPFENSASHPDVDYLCDGITESLIRRVATLDALSVKARSTVFNFKGKKIDAQSIGRQLEVATVLTGAVARVAGRIVISAELVDVASGAQLWSDRYDRPQADVLGVLDEIARAIVDDGIRVRLTGGERRQLAERPTNDPEAYELYLRARHMHHVGSEEAYLSEREFLKQAVARDPQFALAYVALASTFGVMAVDGYERPTESWPEETRIVARALALNPRLIDAQALSASRLFFFDWDWAGADRLWQSIVASANEILNPDVLRPYAMRLWALGDPDAALQLLRRARAIDPVDFYLRATEGDFLLNAGNLAAAARVYERLIEDEPHDPRAYFGLAEVFRMQTRYDEAIAVRRRGETAAGNDSPDIPASGTASERYRQIERTAAQLDLAALADRAKSGSYVSPLDLARAYAQLGNGEAAFRYFDAAFADRAPGLVFLNVDRAWDPIRRDARFVAAVRRVGLPVLPSPA